MRRVPSGAATRQRNRMRCAPAGLGAITASTAEPTVASIGSSTKKSRATRRIWLVEQNGQLVLNLGIRQNSEIGERRMGQGGKLPYFVADSNPRRDISPHKCLRPSRVKNARSRHHTPHWW